MAAWRILGSGVVALVLVQTGWAQTYPLAESVQAGDCFHYDLTMNLAGEIRVTKEGQPASLKLSATGTHAFPERVLVVGSNGLPQKTARVYEKASAAITLDSDRTERVLRPDRTLMVAQRPKDQTLVYCPKGMLTREEQELTSEHFDTLALTALLPGKAVAVGETWKIHEEAVQSLCNFDGLTAEDLACKLEEVKDNVARVSVTGSATGIDLGALAKLKIDATYLFDLASHRLVSLEWKQHDDRDQGPASPATTVDITTTVKRTPISLPPPLTDIALISAPDSFDPPAAMTQLFYHDPKNHFDLVYARDWQTVAQMDDHLVLRLMERGDFVAQVTITPWTKVDPGQHLSPEVFQEAMTATPGWKQEEVLQTGELPTVEAGRWTYRISALGRMDDVKVLQNFYLVAGPRGDQVVLTFTMTQAQAEKLGTRDLTLVGSLDFPTPDKADDKSK